MSRIIRGAEIIFILGLLNKFGMKESMVSEPSFLSKEQQVVVQYREKQGYDCIKKENGFWFCVKGKHRMLINGLGYDVFVGIQ